MMMLMMKSQPLLPIACHPNAQGQYFRRAEPPEKEEILKAAIGLNDLSSRSSSTPSSSEQEAPGKPRINAKQCLEEEAERAEKAPSFGRLVANSGNQPCAAFIPYPHHHLPQSYPQPQPYPLFPQFATAIAKSPSASSSYQSNSLSLQQQLHHPQAMPYFNLQQPFLAAATTNTNNNYNLQNTPTTAHPFATPVPSGHLQPPPHSHPHPLSHPPQSPYSWPFHLIPPTMHAHNTVFNNTSKETEAAATTTATTTMNSKATPSSALPQQGTAEGSAASAVQHTPHRAVTQTSATNSFSPLSLMLAPTDLTAVAAAATLVSPAAVSKEGSQNRTSFLKRKRSSSSSKPKASSDKNIKEQSPPRKERRRNSGSRTRICTSCKTENSPIWRRGANNMRLCNACGLKHRRSLKKKATASQQSSALPENAPSSPSPPASSSSSSDKPSASAPSSSSTTCVTSSPLSSLSSPRSSFSSSPSASFSIPCPPSFSSAAPASSWPSKATSSSKISIASLLN
ncbi:GATA type transcriptional activator of nitrogen-regulated proteins [Balamuthia mandrillaris]